MTRLRKMKKPVLCISSEDDESIANVSNEIHKIEYKENIDVVNIKGTDHLFSDLHNGRHVMNTTIEWALKH